MLNDVLSKQFLFYHSNKMATIGLVTTLAHPEHKIDKKLLFKLDLMLTEKPVSRQFFFILLEVCAIAQKAIFKNEEY
jgi:hypothetical protein